MKAWLRSTGWATYPSQAKGISHCRHTYQPPPGSAPSAEVCRFGGRHTHTTPLQCSCSFLAPIPDACTLSWNKMRREREGAAYEHPQRCRRAKWKWPPSITEVVFAYFMCPAEHSDRYLSAQWKWPPGTPECCLYASGARLCTPRAVCVSQKSALQSTSSVDFWHPSSYPSSFTEKPPTTPLYSYSRGDTRMHPVWSADVLTLPWGGLQVHGSWVVSWV